MIAFHDRLQRPPSNGSKPFEMESFDALTRCLGVSRRSKPSGCLKFRARFGIAAVQALLRLAEAKQRLVYASLYA